jgi:transcriptional regulator with XRE-family HTH domain
MSRKKYIFGIFMRKNGSGIRLREIREFFALNQKAFSEMLGLRQNYLSRYENDEHEFSDELKLKLVNVVDQIYKKRINLDWFISGSGGMFLPQTANSGEAIIATNGVIINKASLNNVAQQVGNDNQITMIPSKGMAVSNEEKQPDQPERTIIAFEIPLLTKEQMLRFDPAKEIPNPRAYSGDYPDYTLAPIPFRFREYSTDLRAIVVFNGLMAPVLNPGDIAIFQATGFNGDGVYIYRMSGDLHISRVKSDGMDYRLTKEFRPGEEIPYDGGTFEAIGRVRAVVREVG